MEIGFIGLGNMGAPMARNLAAAGHAVTGFDVAPVSVEGVRPAASAAEAARERDAVITMLPDGAILGRVYAEIGPEVQGYALAWTLPYRVGCMSVTSAFAFGFDPKAHCASGCRTTQASPYFDSASRTPFTDHGLRDHAAVTSR